MVFPAIWRKGTFYSFLLILAINNFNLMITGSGSWFSKFCDWNICYKLLFVQCAGQIFWFPWCKYCKSHLLLYYTLMSHFFKFCDSSLISIQHGTSVFLNSFLVLWLVKKQFAYKLYSVYNTNGLPLRRIHEKAREQYFKNWFYIPVEQEWRC